MARTRSLDGPYRKQFWLISLLSLLTIAVVVAWVIVDSIRASDRTIERQMAIALSEANVLLAENLGLPLQHLQGTIADPGFKRAIYLAEADVRRTGVAEVLASLLYRNADYVEARWVGANGEKQVRLVRDDATGEVLWLREVQLDPVAGTPFHEQVIALEAFGLYQSDPVWREGNPSSGTGAVPTVRHAIRLPAGARGGTDSGYLVVEQSLPPELALVERLREDVELLVLTEDGRWLKPMTTDAGMDQAPASGESIASTHPVVASQLSEDDTSIMVSAQSGAWKADRMQSNIHTNTSASAPQLLSLTLLAHVSADEVVVARWQRLASVAPVMLLLVGIWIATTLFLRRYLFNAMITRRQERDHKAQLEKSNAFISSVMIALPEGVTYWNREGRCDYANRTAETWLAGAGNNLVGQHFSDLLPKPGLTQYRTRFEEALEGRVAEFAIEPSDEYPRAPERLLVRLVPDVRSDGDEHTVIGIVAILMDITELAKAYSELERSNESLQRRTEEAESATLAKSQFLANMSHEIRTPMNAIIGLLDSLKHSDLSSDQLNTVTKVSQASKSLLTVLNDILDSAKLDAGKMTVVEEPFYLEDVVMSVAHLFGPGFHRKGVELVVWVDPNLPLAVVGDSGRITQVLNNLVGNALKFTHTGSVILSASLLATEDRSASIRFSVKDTGVGIDKEQQQSIFDSFQQADSSTARHFGGTGLGLTIARRLVELMGGRMSLSSSLGDGSEFWFELPLGLQEGRAFQPPDKPTQMDQKAMLVGSSLESLDILSEYLKHWGFNVTVADDPESVRGQLGGSEPLAHVVLELDGYQEEAFELLAYLNDTVAADSGVESRPNVIVASYEDRRDVQHLIDQQAPDTGKHARILTKPISPSALFDALGGSSEHFFRVREAFHEATTHYDWRQLHDRTVLVVEDNELNQDVARSYLERLGVKYDVCANGLEAVRRVEANHYDAILMDLHMPRIDGFEATRKIRTLPNGKTIPIIALSAAVMQQDLDNARNCGMDDHVAKPIEFDVLGMTLHRHICGERALRHSDNTASDANTTSLDAHWFDLLGRLGADPNEVVRRFNGNATFVVQLLNSFARNNEPVAQSLRSESNGREEKLRLVHTLKGSAGTMGLVQLSQTALNVEKQLRQDPDTDTAALADLLDHTLSAIRSAESESVQTGPSSIEGLDIAQLLLDLKSALSRSRVLDSDQLQVLRELADANPDDERWTLLYTAVDEFRYDQALALVAELSEEHV